MANENQTVESPAYRRFAHDFAPALSLDDEGTTILGMRFPKLDWESGVPDIERFGSDALTEYDFALMRKIAISMDLNAPLLIEGGSGIGKSQAVERVCALVGRPMYYANCHDFSADVLIGSMGVVDGTQTGFGWIDGIVMQAIRNGGVLFLDEYNFMLGETRGRLHEILDAILRGKNEVILVENNGERVQVHPEFRIVAAQNPPGEGFTDRYFLDAAQMTRFQYSKEPSSLPEQIKIARTLQSLGVSPLVDVDEKIFLSSSTALSRERLLARPEMLYFLDTFTTFHDEMERMIFDRTVAADQSQPLYLSFQRELNRILLFMGRYWNNDFSSIAREALSFVYENMVESAQDKATIRNQIDQYFSVMRIADPSKMKGIRKESNPASKCLRDLGDTVDICGVMLEKGSGGVRVPKLERFKNNILTEFDRARMQKVALAMSLNQPVLIEGGSGLGKSEVVEWLCAVSERECYYANCQDFTADVLIGAPTTKDGTKSGFGWVDGVVIAAIRNGGVLFLDEYNFMNGETRGRLHEILDAIIRGKSSIVLTENGGEVVQVHPNFRIVAAQNPPGDAFLDRLVLDPAQITRFVYLKEPSQMPYLYKRARALALVGYEVENTIPQEDQLFFGRTRLTLENLRKIPGAADLVGSKFVEFHRAISSVVKNGGLGEMQPQPISFAFQRDLDRLMDFTLNCFDGNLDSTIQTGLKFYFMNRFDSPEDRAKVREMMTHVKLTPKADPRRRTPVAVQTRGADALEIAALPFLEDLIKLGLTEADLLYAIAGFSSDKAHEWRLNSKENNAEAALLSLAGVEDERSFVVREQLAARMPNGVKRPQTIDLSFHGVESVEIDRFRSRYQCPRTIESIAGMTGRAPDTVRSKIEELIKNESSNTATPLSRKAVLSYAREVFHTDPFGALLESYTGIWSEKANIVRNRAMGISTRKEACLKSLAYVDGIEAEDMRTRLGGTINPALDAALLEGLAGIDSAFAWRQRETAIRKPELQEAVAKSLAGLDSKKAWDMRKQLSHSGSKNALKYAAMSITGGPFLAGVRRASLDREAAGTKIVMFVG